MGRADDEASRCEPGRTGGVIRVGLVDDEPLIRTGLRTILDADPGLRVVLEHGDGVGLVPVVAAARCDVVLVDVRMPGRSGLDAIADLRDAGSAARAVVLTTFADAEYLRRAVELAVDGYLTKTTAPDVLVAAVKNVHAGGAALSPVVARWLIDAASTPLSRDEEARRAVAGLTDRHRDVLRGIARGDSNAEIGRALFLSDATVKGYVSEILARLGVTRRVQAAVLAHQAGLV